MFSLCPPESFGIVESGVYRSNLPVPLNFPFIKQLNLRTVLLLSQELPTRVVTQFFDENDISVVHLGLKVYRPVEASWKPCAEELVKDALERTLRRSAHPLLICDTSGIHTVGVLVGCLRKLQGWNLNAIVNEYRSYAGSKTRYVNEQFIELFDTDLVTLPPERDMPRWYLDARRADEEDLQWLEQLRARGEVDPRDGTIPNEPLVYMRYFYAVAAAPLSSTETASGRERQASSSPSPSPSPNREELQQRDDGDDNECNDNNNYGGDGDDDTAGEEKRSRPAASEE